MTITYHCPKCCRFADKERGYYDHSGAAACVTLCPDCADGTAATSVRWLDADGREGLGAEITMAFWPKEVTA